MRTRSFTCNGPVTGTNSIRPLTAVRRLRKELNTRGLAQVDILHPVFREHYDQFEITRAEFEGLRVFRLSKDTTSGYDDSIRHPAVESLIDRFLGEHHYDAVHIHGLGQLSASPIDVAVRRGLPTVMTLHDYWLLCAFWHLMTPDQQLCSGPESTAKCATCYLTHGRASRENAPRTLDFMENRTTTFRQRFHQLTRAVAPSRHLANMFAKFGFGGITVSPYGMRPLVPQPKRPHPGLVIGFAGQIIARKGIDTLLTAFANLRRPDVSLEIWGTSNERKYLERVVARAAQIPNVRYKGGYTADQLPSIFAGIDIAAVPSLMDNFPLVVQEAFMTGTPVVASRTGGIPEAVVDGRNGLLFEPGQADDLLRALRQIVDRPELIADFARHIPAVRTMADDATFYAEMYESVRVAALSR